MFLLCLWCYCQAVKQLFHRHSHLSRTCSIAIFSCHGLVPLPFSLVKDFCKRYSHLSRTFVNAILTCPGHCEHPGHRQVLGLHSHLQRQRVSLSQEYSLCQVMRFISANRWMDRGTDQLSDL